MMNDKKIIYLDNSATTPVCDAALQKYIEISMECYGNPSSLHALGFSAEKEISAAKRMVLDSLGIKDGGVVFTSSGSEANNLAILGRAHSKERYRGKVKIITTDSEHASVLAPIEALKKEGYKTVNIPTRGGKLDTGTLLKEITPDTVLVSIMMVNNETGALYDVKAVSEIIKSRSPEAYLHVDATQSYMKLPFTKSALGADMITLSSHKIEGPKGVGALVIDNKVIKEKGLAPIVLGGGQGLGLRSGTENVPGIAAFGEAIRQAEKNLKAFGEHTATLRSRIIDGIEGDELLSSISATKPPRYAPHILNLTLPKIKSETMLHYLSSRGIYVSSGSACSSNSSHSSSALTAYGRSAAEADTSIRISLSLKNTEEEIDELLVALSDGLSKLSRMK